MSTTEWDDNEIEGEYTRPPSRPELPAPTRAKGTVPDRRIRQQTPRTTSVAGGGNLSTREAAQIERGRKALELRATGMTYEQIAKALGYGPNSKGAVYALLQRYLLEEQREGIAEMRTVQLSRLHNLLSAVWSSALDPQDPKQLQAIAQALQITDRITRLYNLEHTQDPTTTDHIEISNTITVGGTAQELTAALTAMQNQRNAITTND